MGYGYGWLAARTYAASVGVAVSDLDWSDFSLLGVAIYAGAAVVIAVVAGAIEVFGRLTRTVGFIRPLHRGAWRLALAAASLGFIVLLLASRVGLDHRRGQPRDAWGPLGLITDATTGIMPDGTCALRIAPRVYATASAGVTVYSHQPDRFVITPCTP